MGSALAISQIASHPRAVTHVVRPVNTEKGRTGGDTPSEHGDEAWQRAQSATTFCCDRYLKSMDA